ncbi:(2Fe-2S)-binding protein [Bryobacter aggregatus]|uniref:(2Fe-2S)-binding protein n=1 Tax=Bryobacter aggregatus TaxID=360054 RepID=UPI0004E1CFD5|nr:(2Fe-2S)-binding protein [Bryobacter aggregatus]
MDLTINGVRRTVRSDPGRPLLHVLRDELDLTGTKYGCGEGQCGACTVLLDGAAVRSCLTPIRAAQGKAITTIEALERNGELHPVQQAFLQADALQCGFCTAGMIMASVGLLQKNSDPSAGQIQSALQGNLCRCGTYPRIVEAVQLAAKAGTRNV